MTNLWPVAAIGCLLLLVGCAEEPPLTMDTDSQVIQYWLELAQTETPGASEAQIDVLKKALDRGTVLRSDLTEVLPDYYDCLDSAGLTYFVDEVEPVPGSGVYLPVISVEVPADGDPDDTIANLTDACAARHEMYVASAYSNQPTSREAEDVIWAGDAMRTCLSDRGHTVDENATAAEIRSLYDADVLENGQNADYRPC